MKAQRDSSKPLGPILDRTPCGSTGGSTSTSTESLPAGSSLGRALTRAISVQKDSSAPTITRSPRVGGPTPELGCPISAVHQRRVWVESAHWRSVDALHSHKSGPLPFQCCYTKAAGADWLKLLARTMYRAHTYLPLRLILRNGIRFVYRASTRVMQLSALRYFLETARLGSIRRAAEALYVAPSAVSRQIALLEQTFGMPLFERHAAGMRLTSAGEVFASLGRRRATRCGTSTDCTRRLMTCRSSVAAQCESSASRQPSRALCTELWLGSRTSTLGSPTRCK